MFVLDVILPTLFRRFLHQSSMHKLRTAVAALMVLLSSLLSPAAFSQQTSATRVEDNLYYRALFATLAEMQKQWSHIEGSGVDYHRMLVEKNRYITAGLPAQFEDYRVDYLEPQQLIDRYKKLRKPFPVLVVFPMVNAAERIEVSFVLYWVSYSNNSLNYEMSDGSKVYFRYDCAKREYVLDEVRLSGI